jgi:hypothetical protein
MLVMKLVMVTGRVRASRPVKIATWQGTLKSLI